jgi:hypothetical protein
MSIDLSPCSLLACSLLADPIREGEIDMTEDNQKNCTDEDHTYTAMVQDRDITLSDLYLTRTINIMEYLAPDESAPWKKAAKVRHELSYIANNQGLPDLHKLAADIRVRIENLARRYAEVVVSDHPAVRDIGSVLLTNELRLVLIEYENEVALWAYQELHRRRVVPVTQGESLPR